MNRINTATAVAVAALVAVAGLGLALPSLGLPGWLALIIHAAALAATIAWGIRAIGRAGSRERTAIREAAARERAQISRLYGPGRPS